MGFLHLRVQHFLQCTLHFSCDRFHTDRRMLHKHDAYSWVKKSKPFVRTNNDLEKTKKDQNRLHFLALISREAK